MSVIVEKLDTIIEKLDDIASAIAPEVETGPDSSTEYDQHSQVDPGSITNNESEAGVSEEQTGDGGKDDLEGTGTSESPAEQGEN